MEYKKDLNKNIFRGYDVRGIYPDELDEDTAYTFGLGFGSYIRSIGKVDCVVGHDNRLSSNILYNAVIKGITETGINVISLGLCTTPMYYYACIKLKVYSGVMVTASHNPKDDNGFKFAYDESGNCKGEEIQNLMNYILEGNFLSGNGNVRDYDITNDYIELFKSNLKFGDRRVKAVVDPGNGTTAIIVKQIYELFPIDLVYINDISDGRFPNHHPDPCVEKNLDQLKEKVREVGADVGISFDGDGDRMGMVSNISRNIPTDLYMIIYIRDIINKVEKKEFLCDIKCSKTLTDEIEKLGGKYLMSRTGNSYTKARTRDEDFPLGGELSGHVYFRDRWPGFDSGLYAGLRILEILSNTDKSVEDLLVGVNKYYSTEEIKFPSADTVKFEVIDKIKQYVIDKGYDFIDIDGVRILFDDGWVLVRASNTGPNITARFESNTEDGLMKLQEEYTNLINSFIDDINVK